MSKWLKNVAVGMVVPSLLLLGGCGANPNGKNSGTSSVSSSSQPAAPSGVKQRNIKIGVVLQENHSTGKGLKKFAELLEQKSHGNMKATPYFAGQLGDEKKMIEAMQGGVQEVGLISSQLFESNIKEFGIFGLPFVFNNETEAKTVFDGPFGKKLLEKLPKHNLIGLNYWDIGMRNTVNSKHPIAKAEDFQGLKLRSQQVQVHLDSYKALGANPVPLPYSEVFPALESKAIDGAENTLTVLESDKWYEVQKYLSLTEHLYSTLTLTVSKKFWDQLSPEEQKIIADAATEAEKYQNEVHQADVKEAMQKLKAAGIKINEVSPEEREKMRAKVKPAIDQFAKKIGEDLVKELNDEINKVRK